MAQFCRPRRGARPTSRVAASHWLEPTQPAQGGSGAVFGPQAGRERKKAKLPSRRPAGLGHACVTVTHAHLLLVAASGVVRGAGAACGPGRGVPLGGPRAEASPGGRREANIKDHSH